MTEAVSCCSSLFAQRRLRTSLCSNSKLRHSLPKHSGWREMERLLSVEKCVNLASTVKLREIRGPGCQERSGARFQFHLIWTTSGLEPASIRLRTGDLQHSGALNGAAL